MNQHNYDVAEVKESLLKDAPELFDKDLAKSVAELACQKANQYLGIKNKQNPYYWLGRFKAELDSFELED